MPFSKNNGYKNKKLPHHFIHYIALNSEEQASAIDLQTLSLGAATPSQKRN